MYFIYLTVIKWFGLFAVMLPQEDEPVQFTWKLVVLFIIGLYELVVRLIPSVGDISILSKIIQILKMISDFLNVKKKNKG